MKKRIFAAAAVVLLAVSLVWATNTLTSQVILKFICSYTKTGDLNTSHDDMNYDAGFTLANGTGANQANVIWKDTRSLADANSEELDLYDGTLKNGFGDSVVMTKLKLLYVKNNYTVASLRIGGAAATGVPLFADTASDILLVPPGGTAILVAPDSSGYAITSTPHLKLEFLGTHAATRTYSIILVGIE